MVSTPATSAHGQTLFAKNSDRPQEEAQPLVLRPREEHAKGAAVKLQFVEIPQVSTTFRHVGSRPHWCHGYEHGFNEHQVVIGNEGLPSRLPEADGPKLIGMELLRLGLERAATAEQAVDVITGLIERHGQGRFSNDDGVRTYDNIFLAADPQEAYVVEAVGHDWAARRIEAGAAISNVGMIGNDAMAMSHTAMAKAIRDGLYNPANDGRFDFARAFADREASASGIARQGRSSTVLGGRAGEIDVGTMMAMLSDHSDGAAPDEPFVLEPHDGVSICVHRNFSDSPGTTAASLVADLCNDGSRLPVYWCSLYSPCMGLFFPVFMEAELPNVLSAGKGEPSDDSPWWLFYRLTQDGLAGGPARVEEIRAGWRGLQQELLETAYEKAEQGAQMIEAGRADDAGEMLTGYLASNVDRMLATVRGMLAGRTAPVPPAP